jgi:hypothetical protein
MERSAVSSRYSPSSILRCRHFNHPSLGAQADFGIVGAPRGCSTLKFRNDRVFLVLLLGVLRLAVSQAIGD